MVYFSTNQIQRPVEDTQMLTGVEHQAQYGGAAVSWKSRKQTLTALSTVEAEYMPYAVQLKKLAG